MKHGKVFQQNNEILSWKIFTAFYGFTPNNFTAETCLKLLKFFKCLAFVDLLIKNLSYYRNIYKILEICILFSVEIESY